MNPPSARKAILSAPAPVPRGGFRPVCVPPLETRAAPRRLLGMTRAPTRLLCAALAGLLAPLALSAGGPPLTNTESSEGQFSFSLIPRPFQKNPLVDQTVVTELTPDGKKLPPPSPAHPVYYVADSGGYHAEGQGPEDEHPPAAEVLATSMLQALAVNGYQPATRAHPPTLLIVYYWGAHTNLDTGSGEIDDTGFLDVGHKNLLSRAALVGGSKFAEDLRQALQKQDRQNEMKANMPQAYGAMLSEFGPLQLFIQRDGKTRQLYEEAKGDCYYVVASAYDFAAATQGKRVLLWRSKMTVDSHGVAMRDTLPGLILNAGKYLGLDMPEAATMLKHAQRDEHVTLGPLEVEEYMDKPAPPPKSQP